MLAHEFHALEVEGGTIIFAWLVPITREEADAIYHHGWQTFEAALLREDPDLLELRSTSISNVAGALGKLLAGRGFFER